MITKDELLTIYYNDQQQFNYYIIALAVACVGFSSTLTDKQSFNWTIIPLCFAVVCWLRTIWCGIQMVKWKQASIYANLGFMDLIAGESKFANKDPEKIEEGKKIIISIIESNSSKISRLSTSQLYSLYAGIIGFIVWKVFVMATNN